MWVSIDIGLVRGHCLGGDHLELLSLPKNMSVYEPRWKTETHTRVATHVSVGWCPTWAEKHPFGNNVDMPSDIEGNNLPELAAPSSINLMFLDPLIVIGEM